ncbi:uncharacterized protein C8A04DRAFT_24980 [Dichotomopilus funicola]|uniref:Uncharacterized protein n=1 Tax=Dichotomopilus funicola TaxID=1934379 RepID=A0AAN6V9B0_9PEZI|nr:hypothetical protein C8A04DRAFT_24980 [Dichotomopilus funicola]
MDTSATEGLRNILTAFSEQWTLSATAASGTGKALLLNATALLGLLSSITPSTKYPHNPPEAQRNANITIHQPNTPLAPSPLPPPGPSSQSEEIIRQFIELDRSTKWRLADKIPFSGDCHEPEGIVRLSNEGPAQDDRYFVSAGEWTVPQSPDKNGEGFAHLLVFDGTGRQLADAVLTAPGAAEYHGGGLDYDGTHLWVTLAEYRPVNATATLVRLRPDKLCPEPVLRIADHMGAVVHDIAAGDVLTLNWGARSASLWNLRHSPVPLPGFTPPRAVVKNPSHYTDYQDCKFLGRPQRYGFRSVMLCAGITGGVYGANTSIGGVALVDMQTMVPLYELPLSMVSDGGNLVTKNPMDAAIVDGKLRFFFLPDEHNSTLYVYEPEGPG